MTRNELRTNRSKYAADIRERSSQGAMERAEEERQLSMLAALESAYSGRNAPATLTNVSAVVGFSGKIEDMKLARGRSLARVDSMLSRQPRAMAETWLASGHRANANMLEMPATVLAASGANGLSTVGDEDGALVGFTEKDQQPAFLSPDAASNGDGLPMVLVPGATGSGKATCVNSRVPTPSGWTTMGELTVGDLVLGRNGKPTRVTYLSPVENKNFYIVKLSDGQEIIADYDHQWVVSSHMDRNRFKSKKRRSAIESWKAAHRDAAALRAAARNATDRHVTLDELKALVDSVELSETRWPNTSSLYSALHMMDTPSTTQIRKTPRSCSSTSMTEIDPSCVFDLRDALDALIETWSSPTGGNAARWGVQTSARRSAAVAAKEALHQSREVTASQVCNRIRSSKTI